MLPTRLCWFVAWLGALSVTAFLLAPDHSLMQIAAFFTPLAAATLALVWRVASQGARATGLLWLLTSAAVVYALDTVVWYLGPVLFDLALPFPSAVDLVYFAVYISYACFLLGIVRLLAVEGSHDPRTSLIDSLLLTIAMCSVIWVAWIEPALHSDSTPLVVAATLAYPALTLLMFGVAAHLALNLQRRARAAGALLLVWIGAEIVGDIQYGILGATGRFTYGDASSVPWIVSYTALAALAAHPGLTELTRPRAGSGAVAAPTSQHGSHRVARVLVPLGAALVPVVVAWTDASHSVFLFTAAMLAIGLVGLRLVITSWDLNSERALRRELDLAMLKLGVQADLLEDLAYQDTVTGLGNRPLLYREAHQHHLEEVPAALLLLDLDGFKQVNDTHGHAMGDALLHQVGSRLSDCVRLGDGVRLRDTVVRLGGDEFAILLPSIAEAEAVRIADRMLARLREPFKLAGATMRVRGSIGIAHGSSVTTLDELLREADLAMYEAKAAGRDQAVTFDPDLMAMVVSRLRVESELAEAVSNHQFTAYYQPIISAESGRVVSVEALVRWDHPVRGVLPPSEFLATAEHTGHIVPIGEMVLRMASAQVASWRQEGAPELHLAVNVSEKELRHPDYARTVSLILDATGLPPAALCLEVTETVLAGADDIARVLQPLADLGVNFSIDDFGTGHSSLSRLRTLEARRLKIDRSFVAEIDEGFAGTAPLLASIIALAHSIGKIVVAEGVETEPQSAFLIAHGCDELQGYLFSRPVAAPHVTPMLQGHRSMEPQRLTAPTTALPKVMQDLLASEAPLDEIIPRLLREIIDVSDFDCAFYTEVDDQQTHQVTVYAHNTAPDKLAISTGLTVPWSNTLCRRLLDDGLDSITDAEHRYPDNAGAAGAGVRAYLSLPIHEADGRLHGTLCAARSRPGEVAPLTVDLMRLFAAALSTRLADVPGRTGQWEGPLPQPA